jgi:hypothetical protein
VLQPLLLGVMEVRQGLSLLQVAATAAAQQQEQCAALADTGGAPAAALLQQQVAGLLSYPVPLQQSAHLLGAASTQPAAAGGRALISDLADPTAQSVVCQQQLALHQRQRGAAAAAPGVSGDDLVTFQVTLQACRLALHAVVQEVLLAGPGAVGSHSAADASAAIAADTHSSSSGSGDKALGRAVQLFRQLWVLWGQVKAAEAAAAEEAAQTTRTKTRVFLTEEVGGLQYAVGMGG